MSLTASVRAVRPEDVPALVELCLEARAETNAGPALCTDDPERLAALLGTALSLPGAVALLGTSGEEVAALLLARTVGPTPFTDRVACDLSAVYVRRSARRRGLGHAMLAELVRQCEERDAGEVVATPTPGARSLHRFLARAGFQAAAAHRVASVAALHRRLADDPVAPRSGAVPRAAVRLIALRRRDQVGSATSMQVSRAVAMRAPSSPSTTIS